MVRVLVSYRIRVIQRNTVFRRIVDSVISQESYSEMLRQYNTVVFNIPLVFDGAGSRSWDRNVRSVIECSVSPILWNVSPPAQTTHHPAALNRVKQVDGYKCSWNSARLMWMAYLKLFFIIIFPYIQCPFKTLTNMTLRNFLSFFSFW